MLRIAIRFIYAVRSACELLARVSQERSVTAHHELTTRRRSLVAARGHFANCLILDAERSYGVEILRVLHGARDIDHIIGGLK